MAGQRRARVERAFKTHERKARLTPAVGRSLHHAVAVARERRRLGFASVLRRAWPGRCAGASLLSASYARRGKGLEGPQVTQIYRVMSD